MAEKAKNKQINLPEGTLINFALFERDAYKDPDTGVEGEPYYKAEVAIPRKYEKNILGEIEDAAYEAFGDEGADAVVDGEIRLPFIDGDELADDRAERGKPGDAYRGCVVVRASTAFNIEGDKGPGGVEVYNEDVELLEATSQQDRKEIYAGCKVIVRVTISFFKLKDKRDKKDYPFGYGCKLYLVAVQKVGDGERLAQGSDSKSAFKPVGGGTKRRRHSEDEDTGSRQGRDREEPEEDDDDDEAPRRSKRRPRDEEDDDEAPRRKRKARREEPEEDDEEEDDDPKPRRRRR